MSFFDGFSPEVDEVTNQKVIIEGIDRMPCDQLLGVKPKSYLVSISFNLRGEKNVIQHMASSLDEAKKFSAKAREIISDEKSLGKYQKWVRGEIEKYIVGRKS